jgi:membrane protease YdiL (CAAX protease family)
MLVLEVLALNAIHLPVIIGPLVDAKASSRSYLWPHTLYSLLTDICRSALYLFVMFASGDAFAHFGIRPIRWKPDLIAFVLACVGSGLIYGLGVGVLLGHPPGHIPDSLAGDVSPTWLLAILFGVVGITEEIIFRGYLIPRLEEIFGSTALAVIMQAIFFGLVHSYQGFLGMATTLVLGLIFGMVFAKNRSIWPLALAHGITDFVLIYLFVQPS